jgi:hypothetical protein
VAGIYLSFLGLRVAVQSDNPLYLGLFSRLYPRAFTATPHPARPLTFQILTESDNLFGAPVFIAGDEVYRLPVSPPRMDYIHSLVLEHVQQRVAGHFLIHAGVVSRGGRGILLVGDAYYGKSTLALDLTRRGYCFLSDEMAAIGRADGLVHPFPRCLSVRPASADHLEFKLPGEIDESFGNHLFDIEELFPGRMGSAVPIGAVVILSDAEMMPQTPGTSSTRLVHIWVNGTTPAFFRDLRRGKDIANLVVRERGDHTLITLTTGDTTGIADRVRALCAGHHVHLLGISTLMGHRPDFSRPPALAAIRPSQAAIYMLQRFRGGREALLQTTPDGRPARLFAELVELISGAACYTLSVGPLQQMADLVDTIAL